MHKNRVIIIFGATGTAGAGAVQACLNDPNVSEVRAVVRRPLNIQHNKLVEVFCEDFENPAASIAQHLQGVDVCLYCLGRSVRLVSQETEYRKIHINYPLAAQQALHQESPNAHFVYLSGQGAHLKSRMMWARVKAEAEVALTKAHSSTLLIRPGYIHPTRPQGISRWLLGPLFRCFPKLGIKAPQLGKAMLQVTETPSEFTTPIENKTLRRLTEKGWRRNLRRTVQFATLGISFLALVMLIQAWKPLGQRAQGERRIKMEQSPQWSDEQNRFVNALPLDTNIWQGLQEISSPGNFTTPSSPIPVTPVDPSLFKSPPPSGLRVTWLGHSILLIEIGERKFLTDPVWSHRASPFTWLGPERWYPPVIKLEELPPLDAVLISHDHYDHLDYQTITQMRDWDTQFVVPLGIGAHLEYWGVDKEKIIELDWWDEHTFGDVKVVSTPSRHSSGRGFCDHQQTLWCGYALLGPQRRAYFSGDTAMFPGFAEIGKKLGPFDLTMLDSGAYAQAWADMHLGPEQAVQAHQMLRGKVMLPVHWGLFNLSTHNWTEPIERVLAAAKNKGVPVITPQPGSSFEPSQSLPQQKWWPEIPWRSSKDYPIISSQIHLQ